MTNQTFEITVNVVNTETKRPRPMTEREFRRALTGILISAGDFGGAAYNAFGQAAELIDKLPADTSWLGSFTTTAQMYLDQRVPDGCECPRCSEDLMDNIAPQDNGDFVCDCGARYSGDTSSGRPEWWQIAQDERTRRWYVPGRNVYVSIPTD